MPELPHVAGLQRYAEAVAVGRRVQRIRVYDRQALEDTTPAALGRGVTRHRLALELDTGVTLVFACQRRVLAVAAERGGDTAALPPGWLSRGRAARRCPRCGGDLDRTGVAGRSSWFCRGCQAAGG